MPRKAASHKMHCHYRTECGRRCRKPVTAPESRFCGLHEALADAQSEPDLSATLTGGLEKFSSAADINEFLSRLLRLLAENRISPRRAAVLAYITNQILRGIAVQEAASVRNARSRPPEIIWNIPRPPRDPVPQPAPAPAQSGAAAPATAASAASTRTAS